MNTNTKPLISIATPCFNSEKTIERTIQSVLAQEFKDYEYIIVDGGSTDGTLDIIRRYEPLFEGRMRWQSEPDKGIYDAFNKGIKLSKGEFCWNVNSDDWLEPDALMRISQIASNNIGKTCILCCRMYEHSKKGVKESKLVRQDSIVAIAEGLKSMGITHPASIYSHKVYDEVGLYDDRYFISGDIDHFIRCYRSGIVAFIPVDIFVINMSDEGVSNQFNLKKTNHDWRIRFKKFCNSRYEYCKNLVLINCHYLKMHLLKR